MQDLGGLGEVEGTRVTYTWTRASIVGPLVPCLALLVLLALKQNRRPGAWWIWAAIMAGYIFQGIVRLYGSSFGQLPANELADSLKAVNLGVAAVWLLSGYLAWKHRFLTFLAILCIMAVFSLGTCLTWESSAGSPQMFLNLVMVGIQVLMVSIALGFIGLVCRKYGLARLAAWSLPASVVATVLVLAPFFAAAAVANPAAVPIKEFFQIAGLTAYMNFGIVLVYVVLSCRTNFYRQRLIALLHLGSPALPPVVMPEPQVGELAGAK